MIASAFGNKLPSVGELHSVIATLLLDRLCSRCHIVGDAAI